MVTGCDITPRFIVWRVITCGMGGFPNRGRPSFPGYYHSVNFQQNRPILTLLFPGRGLPIVSRLSIPINWTEDPVKAIKIRHRRRHRVYLTLFLAGTARCLR